MLYNAKSLQEWEGIGGGMYQEEMEVLRGWVEEGAGWRWVVENWDYEFCQKGIRAL